MAAAEQFSLRWNNFQSNMTSGFHSLWEGEDLVDVTLAADGRFLQAHKVVLSVCSPYFKTLFKVNPCKHPIVILKDVGYKDLEALLQFMYRGEVNVCQEELPSFLKTAEMLEVKGLTGEESQRGTSPSHPAPTSKLKDRGSHQSSQEPPGNSAPPIKRKRTACPVSPIVIGDEPSSRGSHAEFSELAQPKVEPTDDVEDGSEDYSTEKDATESLATLLGGESSHGGMHAESIQGMDASMFSSLSSHPVQDSGGSAGPQDGSQGGDSENGQSTPTPPQSSIYRHTLSILNSSRGVGILKKNISNQLWRGAGRTAASEYRCSLCQKTFTRRDHLRTHERNLHGQDAGPFTCVICMQLYKNADSLRKHVTKYHYSRESASSTVTDVPS